MSSRSLFISFVAILALFSSLFLFAGQTSKPIPWKDVKRIFEKLKIEHKVSKADDGSEMLLCTWKPQGWTMAMDVSLSDDQRILWIVIKLKKIEDPTKTPVVAMMSLLEENDNIGPAYFSCEKESHQLLFNDPIVNLGITLEGLDEELQRVIEILKRTQKHWDPALWPKT
ncbi:MAG: hypothetical protein U0R49_05445 [Fimbriimonadales bacterium]